MQRFIDEGFEVINSDYPNTYFVKEYIDWERTKVWNIDRVPADAGEKANMILGAFACAWEDRVHLKHSIYSALPAFADRTWNLAPIDDEESFNTALSRFVLGPSIDEGFNVFGDYLIAPFMFDNSLSPISETADRDAAKKLSRGRKNATAEDTKRECERFFKSGNFNTFTSLDGEVLLSQLEKEVAA